MSKASVTKLSGVSIQVASFASTLDLPTSELVAVVSLNLGQSDRIADLRQVLEADGLSTIITNESTLVIDSVQVDIDGLLNGLGLFLVSLKLVADESLTIILATGIGVHLAIEHRISTIQNRGTLNIGIPLTAVSRRCLRSNFVFVQNILHRFFIALIKSDNDFTMRCKRCKRYAHDNHEHSRQQSKQTSFEVRFLHVNFSYSLIFI